MLSTEEMEKLKKEAPAPYEPEKLPLNIHQMLMDSPELLAKMSKADSILGEYNGFLKNLSNPNLLISPITMQEAVLSSKLEGTHATLEDVLNHEAGNDTAIQADEIQEIINYQAALFYALDNITPRDHLMDSDSKSPLTIKIIKEMHKILLSNVRGSTKHPGCFKIRQNYIGGYESISYTPVVPSRTEEYMSNLERYIHIAEINDLIQVAVIHAQFEMIHPFEDGNGRIGRLLIPLFLYYVGRIHSPTFYMSAFFEHDRALYIQMLANISKEQNWVSWIMYFLDGVISQSEINILKIKKILSLYEKYKNQAEAIKSTYFIRILDFVFQHPIFTVNSLLSSIDSEKAPSRQTIYNILEKMVAAGMISVNPHQTKNKTYLCDELLYII